MHVLVLQKHHFILGKVLRIKLAQSFQLILFIVLFSVVAVKGHLAMAHKTFYRPFSFGLALTKHAILNVRRETPSI